MAYLFELRRYVCKSCGLSLTREEIVELRRKFRPSFESEEERRKRERKEYLKWWLSKKK